MAATFGQRTFFQNWAQLIAQIPCGLKIVVFLHFWRKFKNSKWPPFLGRRKFFENSYISVKEIETFLCVCILGENSKWPPLMKIF